MNKPKLGSLFDGSGGFPLAGVMCDIEPVWAAEIEPYPIAVTRSRFPNMKHLGDISKINGAEIEPVDIITFGSPCQDLSVAGKRAGLKHTENGDEETTRSGLFMEAVRIIKEMRSATNGLYPRFALWENVPGAFSSNKGEDFRVVLEELIRVKDPTAFMPSIPTAGWPYSDVYCGDGWSIAYRVLDAQYWGVPQRRRRIYLVADFGGERAGEILFKREGLRGYFTKGGTPWENLAAYAEGSVGADDTERAVPYTLKIRSGVAVDSAGKAAGKGALIQTDKAATLAVSQDQYLFQPIEQHLFENHSQDTRYKGPLNVSPMLPAQLGTGGNNTPFVVESATVALEGNGSRPSHRGDGYKESDQMYTLNTTEVHAVAYGISSYDSNAMKSSNPHSGIYEAKTSRTLDLNGGNPACNQGGIIVCDPHVEEAICVADHPTPKIDENGVAYTLNARDYKAPLCAAYGVDCRNMNENPELYPTLQAKTNGGQSLNFSHAVRVQYIVRRLTPTECARLQGFPDKWGHIDTKDDFTDEEYRFWLDVRNTHAAINGKAVKEYTKQQMLTWYNKLHTDSSEYKMWGNGIALPTALYVMQGIANV